MKEKVSLFLLCLLLFSNNALSGSIDLSIEINPETVNIFSAEDVGEFSITITNNGVDDAGASSGDPFPISIDTERIYLENGGYFVGFEANPDINQDCVLYPFFVDPIPGDPPSVFYSFYTPVIAAGGSMTCYGRYYTNLKNETKTIEWSPLSVTDNDTDPSNNISVMTFRGYIPTVPSLSIFGLVFLTLAVMGIIFRFNAKT
ncbi:hypothetical protein [Marinicella gelatinilytica]|uniref:hypothetical protein n=1 Tax=Marinicella gelatinilytica TaxID=2996017 RepID=UPI002260CCBE|nr:hypothetical protein [Marinicella gelatinilytica]MCX7545874.1 hypothetical protein [Marinicella gelatinilytica]